MFFIFFCHFLLYDKIISSKISEYLIRRDNFFYFLETSASCMYVAF